MNYKSILIVLSLVLTACGGTSNQSTELSAVPTHTLTTSTVVRNTDYPATIDAITDIEIRPQVEGYLVRLFVDEGAKVKKGDPLFLIDPRVYSQRLAEARGMKQVAESQLAKAKIELRNGEELLATKVISSVQFEMIRADYELAKANAAQATATAERAAIELEFTTVKAPVNGVIGKINHWMGALISPSSPMPLTTLSDIETVRAYFSIGEHEYLNLMANHTIRIDSTRVHLLLANGEPYSETGMIDVLNGKFSASGGSILLRATFSNPQYLLRTGNTGKIRIANTEQEVLTVPKAMTLRIQNKTHVYIVANNKLSLRTVEIEEAEADRYIIRSGAQAGDKILAAGLQMAHDGMEVKSE